MHRGAERELQDSTICSLTTSQEVPEMSSSTRQAFLFGRPVKLESDDGLPALDVHASRGCCKSPHGCHGTITDVRNWPFATFDDLGSIGAVEVDSKR
jgi:hypothetical protein